MAAKEDFDTILADSGGSASWFVNTEVVDAQSGASVPSYGSASSITVIITRVDAKKERFPEGFRDGDAFNMYISTDNAVNKLDKITFNSVDYIVHEKLHVGSKNGVDVYQKFLLRKIGAET